MKVLLDQRRHWRAASAGGVEVRYFGDRSPVEQVARAFSSGGLLAAQSELKCAVGQFAAILEFGGKTLAFTDHCRTVPLFHDGAAAISNDAELLLAGLSDRAVDETSALEGAMSGYVTGPYSLYRGLRQLQAGELIHHEPPQAPITRRYFIYKPERLNQASEDECVEQVGRAIDHAIQRVIDAANGAPIWVPLSAGLDSRTILCKLVEFGCSNVRSFSYGPAGNDEARGAREVASRLKVPWQFLPSTRRGMQAYFRSPQRRAYWRFSASTCALPNPQDIVPLGVLMGQGQVQPGDFIVNGQTGDFITGNHIPERLMGAGTSLAEMLNAIMDKHFALWLSLQTADNVERIKRRILEMLGLKGDETLNPQEACALYEQWEYQERQAKFVVAGQRIYDFLGLSWRLPLWDQELVHLFRDLPARRKFGQAPYRAYLRRYDYKGLFRDFHRPVWHWPGPMKAILPAARIVRLTRGPEARDRFLKRFLYVGNYRHHYAPFRYRDFLAHVDDLRSPISLLAAVWLQERGIAVPGLPVFDTV